MSCTQISACHRHEARNESCERRLQRSAFNLAFCQLTTFFHKGAFRVYVCGSMLCGSVLCVHVCGKNLIVFKHAFACPYGGILEMHTCSELQSSLYRTHDRVHISQMCTKAKLQTLYISWEVRDGLWVWLGCVVYSSEC